MTAGCFSQKVNCRKTFKKMGQILLGALKIKIQCKTCKWKELGVPQKERRDITSVTESRFRLPTIFCDLCPISPRIFLAELPRKCQNYQNTRAHTHTHTHTHTHRHTTKKNKKRKQRECQVSVRWGSGLVLSETLNEWQNSQWCPNSKQGPGYLTQDNQSTLSI